MFDFVSHVKRRTGNNKGVPNTSRHLTEELKLST